ncbi:histidine triad (HIT) protein [Thermobaculum terrenum ATCC BAA-798]|uniref:Histidine triad (HIT) protein n=1 Tax=Thermobaculum terrenum (strain ATCC BAA-798 / CCMEE 7001 / YNP1) TaxID=525904 RepID=D1CB06_THET1|nr:histidine triad nucleotide-binding protein [Thermobaculum terrenum]ACZ41971.1 histidine triad (HIT) protein [Thermobaculum terrenum ATCC BAA-798]
MAEDCIFCKIANKEISADEVWRDQDVVAFRDINPMAPVHVLVIPVSHIASLDQLQDQSLAGKLILTASELARKLDIDDSGYRVVINTGPEAGQSVNHLHLHLLGGRSMSWPPG